jgi:(S)-mandelate dehydrogenase
MAMPDASGPQLGGSPMRRYYDGRNLDRAVTVDDLRAMAHRRLPRFVLEYLEGGAEDEASLARDRAAYADWQFTPRQLVDVSGRTLATTVLGRPAAAPLIVAPTGLNGLFMQGADLALAQAAAGFGVPFVQSTMSNERMEDVARIANLRHWWQLYVFGGDEVWQDLLRRADACGCEALVLTTNAQIFGNREWSTRTMATKTRPSLPTMLDAAFHPRWMASTLLHGMPRFSNAVDYVPKHHRGFFETAFWIREHQPTSMDWKTVARIRDRWRKPFLLKGILNADDVRHALDAGVDGIVLGTHGGRQLDSCISGLDLLPQAAQIVQGRIALHLSGGLRRGTDLLKALALGADAVMAGRAPLYGLCAGGSAGARCALDIIAKEALDAMGLLGVCDVRGLGPDLLLRRDEAATRSPSRP